MPARRCGRGDIIFICVGTPPLETGEADLSAIDSVARLIAVEAQTPKLVVEKSTVPAQTGQQLKRALGLYRGGNGVQLRVASNPEFLREGTAVQDFLHPDRIVVGVEDQGTETVLREIYRPILEGKFCCPMHTTGCLHAREVELLITTINSAELIKHASNAFLAMKISYANIIADLCEKVDADILGQAVTSESQACIQERRPDAWVHTHSVRDFMDVSVHLLAQVGDNIGV